MRPILLLDGHAGTHVGVAGYSLIFAAFGPGPCEWARAGSHAWASMRSATAYDSLEHQQVLRVDSQSPLVCSAGFRFPVERVQNIAALDRNRHERRIVLFAFVEQI